MMRYKSLIAKVAIFSLVLGLVAVVNPAQAAALTNMSDVMTDQGIGNPSSHTISFDLPATATWDAGEIATVDFHEDDTGFTVDGSSTATADLDITVGGTEETVVNGASNCGSTDGIAFDVVDAAGQLVLTACGSYTAEAAGSTVVIEYGTAATSNGSGTNRVTNESPLPSPPSQDIDITFDSTDSGTIQAPLTDSSVITINATVESAMTFDLDVGTATGTNSSQPYTVDLGTLSSGAISTSGDGSINMIGVDLDANATGGTVVTVRNANGADGLSSTSTPTDDIEVSTGTFSVNTEAYNICVHRVFASAGTFQATGFDADTLSSTDGTPDLSTTCDASTHNVGSTALSTTATSILNTNSSTISGGRAEIFVKASISSTTPAHDDYTDTLTFIATGTF